MQPVNFFLVRQQRTNACRNDRFHNGACSISELTGYKYCSSVPVLFPSSSLYYQSPLLHIPKQIATELADTMDSEPTVGARLAATLAYLFDNAPEKVGYAFWGYIGMSVIKKDMGLSVSLPRCLH